MAGDAFGLGMAGRSLVRLPLPLRRRAVLLVHHWTDAVERLRGRDTGTGHAALFMRILRMPRAEALRLERAAALHDRMTETEWAALLLRDIRASQRDLRHIRVEEPETLTRLAETGRPVILAPLHMGAYVAGLAHTMLSYFPGRPMLVLRQRDDMPMETAVIERIREVGVEMRFLQVGNRKDFLSAVRFARKGAVIVVFCDLDPSYGAPAAMPIFGMPTRFAFGTDTLARLTDAVVVPWVTEMEPGGDTVRIGTPFEVYADTAEERARAAGLMRRHIEDALRRRPEQWHLWPMLSDYLPPSDILPGAASSAVPDPVRDAA
ncbi:hypothetical protein ASG52_19500 [Methylobacterium sp. Leaf456]|uniref:lysophospholipid acyltransferase family protein n=1 Tax=Methylobacterium sp. Leaf456 TaxID=1736382 RepID=UPI0006F5405A|nr:lysophospholipid acyltransferase family protein [Methylobacterium sp. Leaf456]KQT59919.1 hypothetical protein ASG52_19500 [Methylobacterium sp. Leaf456]